MFLTLFYDDIIKSTSGMADDLLIIHKIACICYLIHILLIYKLPYKKSKLVTLTAFGSDVNYSLTTKWNNRKEFYIICGVPTRAEQNESLWENVLAFYAAENATGIHCSFCYPTLFASLCYFIFKQWFSSVPLFVF